MLADGKAPKEIAYKQRSTLRAIQQTMYRLRIDLAARTTIALIVKAVRKGYIR